MAGQGVVTARIAQVLLNNGWIVVYTCIPNTAHVNVVPIPTQDGVSMQRYPDIVAFKGEATKLVEVEMRLSTDVAADIITRFSEMVSALRNQERWMLWRLHVAKVTNQQLPDSFVPQCDLIICSGYKKSSQLILDILIQSSIKVHGAENYSP